MRARGAWLAAALVVVTTGDAVAQRATRRIIDPRPIAATLDSSARVPKASRRNAPLLSIAASVLIPGTGQAILGVDRFVPYSAFEIYQWSQFAAHSGASRRQRREYRSLAALVARAPFASVLPDGNFDYYERLEHWLESGVFEETKGGVLDPETDTTTFNGSIWLLARRTYWRDVNVVPDTGSLEWKQAADFYRRRAYDTPYRWSWRNAQLQYDEYRRFIHRSNESNRKSLQDLGTILANHMLSMIDAFVTVRLRRRPEVAAGGYELSATLPLAVLRR